MLLFQQFDQAKADAARREDERIYKSMFENNHAIMFIVDPTTGTIIDCNTSASDFYGYGRSVMIGMNIDQINILTPTEIKEEMAKAVRSEKQYFEFRHRKADGSIATVEVYSGPIERGGKNLLYTIVHDITSKVIAQNSLIQRDRLLVTVLNYSPYAIFVQMDMKFWYLNQTACDLFGVDKPEDLIGTPFLDRFSPECHESVTRRLTYVMDSHTNVDPTDQVVLRMDGTPIDVNVVSVSYEWDENNGTMTFAKDITKEKAALKKQIEMESRVREQQKLESIGILAGGVAHEINNPLNGIMNYAELIKDEIKETNSLTYADEIINETMRISEIVRNLLQFSRMEKQTHSYAKIYDIIKRTISLTNTIFLKDNITIYQILDDNLPDIKCRSQQIQQVLMNLLTNARDALNDKYPRFTDNKRIEVRCSQYFKDDRRWIALSVKDFGTGVSDEVKSKIFEPFYSTKPKDKGTGLGLSISYGIIKDHHGTIEIDSKLGEYTNFIVHLPVDNGWDQEGENHV
jgi:PAS domain S-box-containing protein